MKRRSLAAAIFGALITCGVLFWIGASGSNVSPRAAREAAARSMPPLPFAESGEPSRTREFSAGDNIDTQTASPADLLAAADRLNEMLPGEERTSEMRRVFREWAVISPRDALTCISTMEAEQDRNEAREFVCHRVAEDHPKQAFDLAWQIGANTATPLVRDLAHQWAGKDIAAAMEWALTLPPSADRDQILARVCQVLSQSDPLSAGAIVAREIPTGPVQDEAAMSVLHQWAIRDFASASKWIARFPEGSLRIRAEEELAGIGEYLTNSRETP